jgi:monoterpene epsilon-lactone hydrolase
MAINRISLATQRTLFSLLLRSTPIVRETTVSRTVAGGVPAAWVVPSFARKGAVLFYLHGGGYCWGSIQSHLPFVSQLASAVGCKALLVDYRLAPEHPFPAALEDAMTAYRWLCETEPDSQIQIAGDSAGAGLSVCLMLSLKNTGPLPAAGFLLSPWADLDGQATGTDGGDSGLSSFIAKQLRNTAERYANGESLRDPRISPVYGDLSGLPPLLIHGGNREFLARDAVVLSERARGQGVDVTFEQYEGRMHALHSFVHLSRQAREYLERAADFLHSRGAGW